MLNQNYKESLINSINIFCKNINCSNCGGTYNFKTFACENCDEFNEELKKSYDTISSIIPNLNEDNIDKEIILYLYKLNNSSGIFNHVLEQFDLTKDTKNIIKELETKVEYNDLDVKLLEGIFSNDIFLNIDSVLRDIILRNVILGKNNLSEELIEKVISHLVLSDTRKISKDSRFYIRNLGDKVEGLAFHYYVCLDKEVMDNFYDNGDISIFYVLPHEMMHTYRTYLESKGIVSSIYDVLALKERLLREYNQDIYFNDKNYIKNLHEIEANAFSYHSGTNYLKSLGFEIKEDDALRISGIINNDLTRLDNPLREIDGELVNINELFADFIKDKKDFLYKYPQLHYEFKEEEGQIVYKSKMELVDEMIFQNKDESLEELYLYLIKNAQERERIKDKSDTLKS